MSKLAPANFSHTFRLADGRMVALRNVLPEDLDRVRGLYRSVYGDRYTLAEVMDEDKTAEVLTGQDWHWIMAECQGAVVASLLLGREPSHRLGKALGGVVEPEFRGHKLMRVMLEQALLLHLHEDGPLDLLYAVVRTFISLSFHHDLAQLGFIDTGIFPNVRKVSSHETHGLKVLMAPQAFRSRRTPPRLIQQTFTMYEIARSRLALGPCEVYPVELAPLTAERLELVRVTEPDTPASRKQMHQQTKGQVFNFFPLHGPDMVLTDPTGTVRVFLSYQAKDGHATVLGFTAGNHDRAKILMSIADYCENLGCVYLELLVSAYEPVLQAQAYQAGFLPCAYFPAAYRGPDGRREDYIVTSKTFVPLHFRGLKLTEEAKPFLLEFFKLYTSSLWEDLMDA